MTFERPWVLALLVAVPLAWWIHRRRSGAPVVRVASLLAFEGASTTSPSSAPRAALDWRIAFVLTAMTLLALSAAGPAIGASRGDAFFVVVDRSPSMSARTCDALRRSELLLHDAAPDAGRVDRALSPPGAPDGLPESLAAHLDDARRQGFPGVVLVTDAPFAAIPGVVVIGPSAGASANAAVTGAVLDGEAAVVTVRNFGASDAAVRISADDGVAHAVTIPGRGIASVRFPAPRHGERAIYSIASPPDDFAADDRLVVKRRGGARRVALSFSPSAPCPRLEAALRAAGAEIVADGELDVAVHYRWPIDTPEMPHLLVAPVHKISTGAHPPIRRFGTARIARVAGSSVTGRASFADVLPSPSSTLVVDGQLSGGDTIWSFEGGVVAAVAPGVVVLTADPEEPGSDWHRDPSFPAFVAAALDHLTGGPDRLDPADPVPASESDVVRDPARAPTLDEIVAAIRPAGAISDAVRPAGWLALLSALLLLCAALVPRR